MPECFNRASNMLISACLPTDRDSRLKIAGMTHYQKSIMMIDGQVNKYPVFLNL
ncbi:hypothetical protein KAS42_03235 [bacterium]|nr:hypothetical protein [bacterium]